MKDYQNSNSNRICKPHYFSRGKKGAHSAEVGARAPGFEKSPTELKLKPKPKLT